MPSKSPGPKPSPAKNVDITMAAPKYPTAVAPKVSTIGTNASPQKITKPVSYTIKAPPSAAKPPAPKTGDSKKTKPAPKAKVLGVDAAKVEKTFKKATAKAKEVVAGVTGGSGRTLRSGKSC